MTGFAEEFIANGPYAMGLVLAPQPGVQLEAAEAASMLDCPTLDMINFEWSRTATPGADAAQTSQHFCADSPSANDGFGVGACGHGRTSGPGAMRRKNSSSKRRANARCSGSRGSGGYTWTPKRVPAMPPGSVVLVMVMLKT